MLQSSPYNRFFFTAHLRMLETAKHVSAEALCRGIRLVKQSPLHRPWKNPGCSMLMKESMETNHDSIVHGSLVMSPLNITQPLDSIRLLDGYYKVMSNIPKMGHLPTPVVWRREDQPAGNHVGKCSQHPIRRVLVIQFETFSIFGCVWK